MTLCSYCGFERGGVLCGTSNPEACAAAAPKEDLPCVCETCFQARNRDDGYKNRCESKFHKICECDAKRQERLVANETLEKQGKGRNDA